MWSTIFFAAAALASLCLAPSPAVAGPADFETPEYNNGTGLRSLNASDAYDLGFTGKGVTVGVADNYFSPPQGEFEGKYPYGAFIGTDVNDPHDSHVAGIIAARRDGTGMHGAAFDAGLYPVAGLSSESWEGMKDISGLTVINNSWGENVFPDQSRDFPGAGIPYSSYYYGDAPGGDANFLKNWLKDEKLPLVGTALELAEADKLLVFAAGNEGHLSPGGEAALPTLVEKYKSELPSDTRAARDLKLHWINVAAFDPRYVKPDGNGAWVPSGPAFPANFTNMGLYAKGYTLWAPGVDIYSTLGPRQYAEMSGTSMAAPYVSGVAALAQSAFPYMGGKQIADVLLSTATKLDGNNTPAVFVLTRQEYDEEREMTDPPGALALYYDAGRYDDPGGITVAQIRARDDYDQLIGSIRRSLDRIGDPTDPEEALEDLIDYGGATGIDQETYLSLFGAGIVNAGKAVRGPGHLDANRLDNSDRAAYGGTDYAMYPVDTRGLDSAWSNDIGQVSIPLGIAPTYPDYDFIKDIAGLDVGLLKTGEGVLSLTGNNTYEGMTDVRGGGISLGRPGQADGAARLAGSVSIGPDGMFTGNGYVGGDLESRGLLIPGPDSGPGDLTVNGDVTSDGRLLTRVWPEAGRANRLNVGGALALNNTTVDIADMAGGRTLPAGSYEIAQSAGALSGAPVMGERKAAQGVTLLHTFGLNSTGNTLSAVHRGTEINPRAKALSEGFIGATAMLNQGADLAAGAGIENAAGAAKSASGRAGPGTGRGVAAFGAISAGWSRYGTGSHVDMRGFSLLTGFSLGRELPPGFLTLGAFIEFGSGFYDTYNSFGNAAAVHGDGQTEYFGGGVLARMDFSRTGPGRFHAEASARIGRTMTDYDGTDLRDYRGRAASYSSESAYYGLHAGLGYAWEMTDEATLDLYGKYFWTRQAGDRVTLSTGDPVRFEDADSHRARAGARFSYKVNDGFAPYLGAAYEREFDGRVRASTNGFSLPAPSLYGDTGVWEIGIVATSAGSHPALTVNAGVQGYTGKRGGLTCTLQFRLEF